MTSNNDSASAKLTEVLNSKLHGSTMDVVRVSPEEVQIKAGEDISININMDISKKQITFNLFSPSLKRSIMFEEINGTKILDMRLADQLKTANHEAEELDAMIAIDLLTKWSNDNNFKVMHVP